jgi:hypothetical protein
MERVNEFYTQVEFNSYLMVREEYPIPATILQDYQAFLMDPRDSLCIRMHRKHVITDHQIIIQTHSLKALLTSYDIWKTLPNALRNITPT